MKLLVLLSRFPYPLDKGDKLRAFHQLRYLAQHHEICLFALSDEPVTEADYAAVRPLCAGGLHVHRLKRPGVIRNMAQAFLAGRPFQVGYFYDSRAQRVLDALLREFQPAHVYCQLVRMAEYLKPHLGRVLMTLDYMDALAAGVERRADNAPAWQRPVMLLEASRLRRYEGNVFNSFQHHTIISGQDRQLIDHPRSSQIQVVVNGIDTDYFQPMPRAKEYELLFCGNMGYHPNIDAAEFLAGEILPLVRQQVPQARLLIAGTTPAARVQALASDAVTVSGWLPDIRDAYAGARVFVAPMRVGTGLQNKLLEAMAMELPCVTTPLANNALQAQPDQQILVGGTGAELAAHLITLLTQPARAEELAASGRQFVRQHYTWSGATTKLEALFGA